MHQPLAAGPDFAHLPRSRWNQTESGRNNPRASLPLQSREVRPRARARRLALSVTVALCTVTGAAVAAKLMLERASVDRFFGMSSFRRRLAGQVRANVDHRRYKRVGWGGG